MTTDKAYLGIYTHRHGADVDLYFSKEDAWHTLAQIAFGNIEDLDEDNQGDAFEQMVTHYRAGNFKAAALAYVEYSRDEEMEVREIDVNNARKPPGHWSDEQLLAFSPEHEDEEAPREDKSVCRVEYDLEYTGGDYYKVGDFVDLTAAQVNESGADDEDEQVYEAFEKVTGHSRVHVVHYCWEEGE